MVLNVSCILGVHSSPAEDPDREPQHLPRTHQQYQHILPSGDYTLGYVAVSAVLLGYKQLWSVLYCRVQAVVVSAVLPGTGRGGQCCTAGVGCGQCCTVGYRP